MEVLGQSCCLFGGCSLTLRFSSGILEKHYIKSFKELLVRETRGEGGREVTDLSSKGERIIYCWFFKCKHFLDDAVREQQLTLMLIQKWSFYAENLTVTNSNSVQENLKVYDKLFYFEDLYLNWKKRGEKKEFVLNERGRKTQYLYLDHSCPWNDSMGSRLKFSLCYDWGKEPCKSSCCSAKCKQVWNICNTNIMQSYANKDFKA